MPLYDNISDALDTFILSILHTTFYMILLPKLLLENLMTTPLRDIADLQSGVYAQPQAMADTYYLQSVHFDKAGNFDAAVRPQLKSNDKLARHRLRSGDILFAAKGLNNFGTVYEESIGPAVASSSFIVIRLHQDMLHKLDPHYLAWYLGHALQVKQFHKQLGTTIPSISISALSELEIGIIPMERQQLILQIQSLKNQETELMGLLEEKRERLINQQLLNATTI